MLAPDVFEVDSESGHHGAGQKGNAILAALATSPPVPKEWVEELERAIRPKMTVGELHTFLQSLPILGDDADQFAEDIRKIRSGYPQEANPWD